MPWVLQVTAILWSFQLVLALYLTWRTNVAWVGPRKYRNDQQKRRSWLVCAGFFSFGLYPIVGIGEYLLTGHAEILAYPGWIVYWYWYGILFCVLAMNGILVFDLIKLIMNRWLGTWTLQWWQRAVLVWILLVAPYTALKLYADTSSILIDKHEIDLPSIERTKDNPLRIAHISDIQADKFTGSARMQAYNNRVSEYNPDLVIFTGDLISYGTDYIATGAQHLGELGKQYPTWSVMGDHDFWSGLDTVMAGVRAENIPVLQDSPTTIAIDDINLRITGLLNVYSKRPEPQTVDQLLSESKRDSTAQVRLLISHQMDNVLANRAAQNEMDLVLSGHTHGGQLAFPFWGWEISGPSLETDLLSGLYHIAGMPVNVNNGLGFTLAPVRYNAPASVSIIDLY